jgi:hypothetical protein
MALQCRPQLGRQARGELLVIPIDEAVLVAQGEGIGDAHADVLVGADHLAGAGFDRGEVARHPAVQVLHGGDARGDHLEGGIERVEVEIDPPRHQPRHEPQLERHVGRAELHRGQPIWWCTLKSRTSAGFGLKGKRQKAKDHEDRDQDDHEYPYPKCPFMLVGQWIDPNPGKPSKYRAN